MFWSLCWLEPQRTALKETERYGLVMCCEKINLWLGRLGMCLDKQCQLGFAMPCKYTTKFWMKTMNNSCDLERGRPGRKAREGVPRQLSSRRTGAGRRPQETMDLLSPGLHSANKTCVWDWTSLNPTKDQQVQNLHSETIVTLLGSLHTSAGDHAAWAGTTRDNIHDHDVVTQTRNGPFIMSPPSVDVLGLFFQKLAIPNHPKYPFLVR
jgi:hypothetical protein